MSNTVSRRDFLKASATGAAGAAALASASVTPIALADEAAEAQPSVHLWGMSGDGSWLGEKPVVDEADVTEEVTVDVVVVGGGHSGTMAALGAVDEGASVAVIEVQPWGAFVDLEGSGMNMGGWYGEDIGHVNSKWLLERGFGPYNTGDITWEFVKRSGGRVDTDLIRKFVQNSGAMVDRQMEIYASYEERRKEEDSEVFVENDLLGNATNTVDFSDITQYPLAVVHNVGEDREYPCVLNDMKTWPCNIQFYGHQGNNIEYFMKYMKYYNEEHGAQYFFEHRAIVLIQNEAGDVTGVYAEDLNNPGTFKKFNANNGVVICAGDFKGNADMCWCVLNEHMEWAERSGLTKDDWDITSTRNGDGIKMVCWAGGIMETIPRGTQGSKRGASGPWGMAPFLQLDCRGKRFWNEAGVGCATGIIQRAYPGMSVWISDAKWNENLQLGSLDHGAPNFGWKDMYDKMCSTFEQIEVGNPEGSAVSGCGVAESYAYMSSTVFAADTLEELLGFLGYDEQTIPVALAEIEHYNEMCASEDGDIDYGKEKALMFPICDPPYYGGVGNLNTTPSLGLVTLAGVVTDAEFRACRNGDKNDLIKGLYVAGNSLGNRYPFDYVSVMAGNSIGQAQCHGWLAGQNAAKGV